MAAAQQRYLEAEVRTASPLRLVLITYDVALSSLARAAALDPARERFLYVDALSRAQQALLTLMEGLDFARSPELAGQLARLYGYFYRRLAEALADDDRGALEEVRNRLSELREAWQELLERGLDGSARQAPREEGRLLSVTG